MTSQKEHSIFSLAVIVAALGYFVDIYDLLLFTIVKKTSVLDVGATTETLLVDSTRIINWQMFGLLLGGILWGVLGDKKGRLSVLFGSILLYSVANFATGFIHSVNEYAACRFVAGIGLFGAVCAYFTFKFTQDWRLCYKIGGGLGIGLLLLRISVAESGMFKSVKESNVSRGNFFMFFNNITRFRKYILAILIGLPTWYVIGILVNQSDLFAKKMYDGNQIDSGRAIMFAYAAIATGDILIGLISQYFKSRKKALYLFYGFTIVGLILFFSPINNSDVAMYSICAWLGFSTGFWAIFVTMGAEQFGTNLRATAATTIPNMVRGALPLINLMFLNLFQKNWGWGLTKSGIITGVIVMAITLVAAYFTQETFHKDLNYIEGEEMLP
ncbi:MAG TPA: MFS transporter [Lacibacter sp.]|nr:MFS transporter [Lacibacter sp.]